MICTFVFGGMMPSTALAVDGSARTLSCVDETPSTGVMVSVGGGLEVSVGSVVNVADVVVRTPVLAPVASVIGVAEVISVGVAVAVQPLIVNTMMIYKVCFDLTY